MSLPNGHDPGGDWIEDYLLLTKGISSPPLYKLWSAIALLSAAAQRRVWTRIEGEDNIYPNLYVFLVGKPGKGKGQAMKPIISLSRNTIVDKKPIIHCAPDNATKEGFIDELADARVHDVTPSKDHMEYHSLFLCCTEFSELMPEIDKSFMSALSKFWDNEDVYIERRRSRKVKTITITCPSVTILSGIQPAYIGRFPIEIWERGFCARTMFIYAEEKVQRKLFGPGYNLETLDLQKRLIDLHNRYGPIDFSPAARDLMDAWEEEGYQPRPTHPRLEHYVERRSLNLAKIATISSLSRSCGQIEVEDLNRAFGWMVEAEKPMAQMFGQMVSSQDTLVLDETLEFFRAQTKLRPDGRIKREEIFRYLSTKVDLNRVGQAFETMVNGNYFKQKEYDFVIGDPHAQNKN